MGSKKDRGKTVLAAGTVMWRLPRLSSDLARLASNAPETDNSPMPILTDLSDYVTYAGDSRALSGKHAMQPSNSCEICLIHRARYDDWSLPKGHVEKNESFAHTAVRETNEETGIPVRLGAFIGSVEYLLHADGSEGARGNHRGPVHNGGERNPHDPPVHKRVLYWIGTPITHAIAKERVQAFGHSIKKDTEADHVVWMPVAQALDKLSYHDDVAIVRRFAYLLDHGAGRAGELILIRSAQAEPHKHWKHKDSTRPLQPLGAASAYALSRELACFAPDRLMSSPSTRAVQTLIPYAIETNQSLTPVPDISSESLNNDPQTAIGFLTALLDRIALSAAQQAAKPEAVDESGSLAAPTAQEREPRHALHAHHSIVAQNPSRGGTARVAVCTHKSVIEATVPHLAHFAANADTAHALTDVGMAMDPGQAMVITVTHTATKPVIVDVHAIAPVVY
jgi:8-oxo-dGTP pyrophosphatase MutT (NUDIX family)/broad specificity phosphatase PhoE